MRAAMQTAKLFVVDEPLSPHLEITRFISEFSARHQAYPTFLFRNVQGFPKFQVVMNLLKRPALLRSMGVPDAGYLGPLEQRMLHGARRISRAPSLAKWRLEGVASLPVLWHQPGDVGRYFTSAVGALHNPADDVINLGFYRALVKADGQLVVFMDPRTDAFQILRARQAEGEREVPFTLFIGGPPAAYLSAAAGAPRAEDSYDLTSRLMGKALTLDEERHFPPAPADAELVIHGHLLEELATEAPFGEFKGYYSTPTQSPVLRVDEVWSRPDPYFVGLFCGKESGLTLMSLQNELLMFQRLRALGFAVDDVAFPLSAFGEFLALVQTPKPGRDVLEAALDLDRRAKLVVVAEDIRRVLAELSIFDFEVVGSAYHKRGKRQGDRLGLIAARGQSYQWVEF